MFNLYSKGCEYAIRALVAASRNGDPRFTIRRLCQQVKVSESFTRKVFQQLVRKKILQANRGPGGGYEFKAPAPHISLYQLILAIDGSDAFNHCVMGLPECHDKNPCVFHPTWVKMKDDAIRRLKAQTLSDLINQESPRPKIKSISKRSTK